MGRVIELREVGIFVGPTSFKVRALAIASALALELGAHKTVTMAFPAGRQVELVEAGLAEILADAQRDAGCGGAYLARVPHRPGWVRLEVALA